MAGTDNDFQDEYTKGLQLTLRGLKIVVENIASLMAAFSGFEEHVRTFLERQDETNEMCTARTTIPLSEIRVNL